MTDPLNPTVRAILIGLGFAFWRLCSIIVFERKVKVSALIYALCVIVTFAPIVGALGMGVYVVWESL